MLKGLIDAPGCSTTIIACCALVIVLFAVQHLEETRLMRLLDGERNSSKFRKQKLIAMKVIGLLLIFFGIATGMYAFAFKTTVSVDNAIGINSVNNIGLLNDKQNILFVAGVLCIMGSVFVAGAYRARTDWGGQNFSEQPMTE